MRRSEIRRALPYSFARLEVSQQLHQGLRDVFCAVHLNGATLALHAFGNRFEVLHIRPKKNRLSTTGRLENIMTAGIDQTSADKSHVGRVEEFRQLADRIEQQDIFLKILVRLQSRLTCKTKGRLLQQFFHLGEAFWVARR